MDGIDFVITWVDGSDEDRRREKARFIHPPETEWTAARGGTGAGVC